MAKHEISGTSTVCGAAGHSWQPGLATNYRQCKQCRSVEVLIDGQWVSPTGRAKRSRNVVAPAPATSWLSEARVKHQDLQATKTQNLVEMPKPAASTVPLSNSSTVSGDEHFKVMTRRNRGEVLFKWGREHGFPQFCVKLAGRTHTIVSGESAWRMTCFRGPLEVVEAAIEQSPDYRESLPELPEEGREERLKLLEMGRARNWARFLWRASNPGIDLSFSMVLDGGEIGWTRYASSGRYEHICQACEQLEAAKQVVHVEQYSTPKEGLQQVRDRFLRLAEAADYPELRFRVADEGMVYKIIPGMQKEYEDRALNATLGWLWNAVQALELRGQKKMASDGVIERAGQELQESIARHEAEKSEQWYRGHLVMVGRSRKWDRATCTVQSSYGEAIEVVVGPGEREWCDYALHGDVREIGPVCEVLEQQAAEAEKQRQCRVRLVQFGQQREWVKFRFTMPLYGRDTAILVGPGEELWREFASNGEGLQVVAACDALEA